MKVWWQKVKSFALSFFLMLLAKNYFKKFEPQLKKRAKAYSSSGSVV